MTQTQLPVATSPAGAGSALARFAEPRQYLVFSLCGESFAIAIQGVKEIIEYGQLTEVPMMPKLVRGVINLRGAVVPVVDLAVRFGRTPTAVARRTCIVIVEMASDEDTRQVLGVIVDAVNEVLEIAPQDIEPPPSFGARIRSDFIEGMGKVGGQFVILLDMSHALSIDELSEIVGTTHELSAEPATQGSSIN
ncbi:Chemotaxis protein CheW [Burkholderiales bacterium]|nr:MAG: purine-binding chemotaxis protein CheW [Burkholderiales bacterium]CAG0982750.1 Chemotaxis protein CheW [Burkholderiales bacterium]